MRTCAREILHASQTSSEKSCASNGTSDVADFQCLNRPQENSNNHFDPTKYQDLSITSGSSGWSHSVHSNAGLCRLPSETSSGGDYLQPNDSALSSNISTHTSSTDYSLHGTRRILNFDDPSKSGSSSASQGLGEYSEHQTDRNCHAVGHYSQSIKSSYNEYKPEAHIESTTRNMAALGMKHGSTSDYRTTQTSSQAKHGIWKVTSPLCAQRLRAIRQRTRNAVVSLS